MNMFTASGFRLQFCVCGPTSTEEKFKTINPVPRVNDFSKSRMPAFAASGKWLSARHGEVPQG